MTLWRVAARGLNPLRRRAPKKLQESPWYGRDLMARGNFAAARPNSRFQFSEKCVSMEQALLTQLLGRIEDGKSADVAGDACVALHCAAAIGDNERARTLIEPAGKRPPLVKVDVADSLGRTALHWACFLSMQNAADFLIGQGADPERRALSRLDAIWGTGIWDSRLRSTEQGEDNQLLPASDGSMMGATALEMCFQLHAARILVKGSVDIAMDRRQEDDFVGASARSPAFI